MSSNIGLYIICFVVVMVYAAFTERHDVASIAWFYGLILFGLVKLASNQGFWIVLVLLVAGFIISVLYGNCVFRAEMKEEEARKKEKESEWFRYLEAIDSRRKTEKE